MRGDPSTNPMHPHPTLQFWFEELIQWRLGSDADFNPWHEVALLSVPQPLHYTCFMRPFEALSLHHLQIREIALRHRVSSVRVFGSALHGDDTTDSDLDLLVEPTPQTTLMDIGAIRFELKQLLGMEVDVLAPNSLPASFRDQVLREAMAV